MRQKLQTNHNAWWWCVYYVRLKPSNLWNYSWTKCQREGYLLIPGTWEAAFFVSMITVSGFNQSLKRLIIYLGRLKIDIKKIQVSLKNNDIRNTATNLYWKLVIGHKCTTHIAEYEVSRIIIDHYNQGNFNNLRDPINLAP